MSRSRSFFRRLLTTLFYVFPLSLFGLDRLPWFCNIWEFTLTPSYTYSSYRQVQQGVPTQKHPSHDHLVAFDLAVPPSPEWQIDSEIEFVDTSWQSMGFRSVALQARYLWLNDLLGDKVSLTTGGVVRSVSHRSLKDVSSPYHAKLNLEINLVMGREWDRGFSWRFRTFGGAFFGMASRGFPWYGAFAVVEGQMDQTHRLGLCIEGVAGMGHEREVIVNHFNGYAFIRHRNLDIGLRYTYVFDIWGKLTLAYTRRVYARSFPEKVNFFTVSYILPFSLF